MAEMNNLTEITENFDTIKTLLNSIRAQGILNTSDVDKLLTGINTKLEKINTDEDIDLIKVFLTEMKQTLEERHSVLVAKFGAIESLFSNLLKNSTETVKSSEIKELFDIVATNLSVFSREVVAQKDSLNDINLRLDAIKSDDSQKKEIIKNVAVLKNDLDRLSNGFDSIVLSLNENFKTIVKNISAIDPSESINNFGEQIDNAINSFNAVMSAVQIIDKKNDSISDALQSLATKEDINTTKLSIVDLALKSKELSDVLNTVSERLYKADILAEKIDASVNIIAGLKAIITDSSEKVSDNIISNLNNLETMIQDVKNDDKYNEFKLSFDNFISQILDNSSQIKSAFDNYSERMLLINDELKRLDIDANFQNLQKLSNSSTSDIKDHIDYSYDKITQILDVNINKAITEISENTTTVGSRLNEAGTAISELCSTNFLSIKETLDSLKYILSQIEESDAIANNAIFANISDRLVVFENNLNDVIDRQESNLSNSSDFIKSQISNISEVTNNLDYKLDNSIIEFNGAKNEVSDLKNSIQSLLSLDFMNALKDLRADLYAVKQDLTSSIDNNQANISDTVSNDLFSKYELLISKMDSLQESLSAAQLNYAEDIKQSLDKISASIIDVLSYVSDTKIEYNNNTINSIDITEQLKSNHLTYIENVRDIIDGLKTQLESNIKEYQAKNSDDISLVNKNIEDSAASVKDEIQNSYNKLVEVHSEFDKIKETLNLNNISLSNYAGEILSSSDSIKSEFEAKLSVLKNALIENITEFKREFTCDNADKINELKINAENIQSKNFQEAIELNNDLKNEMSILSKNIKDNINLLEEQLAKTTLKVESTNNETVGYMKNDFLSNIGTLVDELKTSLSDYTNNIDDKTEKISSGFDNVQSEVEKLSNTTTAALSSTLAQILDNFIALKSIVNSLGEKNSDDLKQSVTQIIEDFQILRNKFDACDAGIDEELSRQISIIESNFDSISNSISEILEKNSLSFEEKMLSNLGNMSERINSDIDAKLDDYKEKIEDLFNKIIGSSDNQSEFINSKIIEMSEKLNGAIIEQNDVSSQKLNAIADNLQNIIQNKIDISTEDYNALKNNLQSFLFELTQSNTEVVNNLKNNFDGIKIAINNVQEQQKNELSEKFANLKDDFDGINIALNNAQEQQKNELSEKFLNLKNDFENVSTKMSGIYNEIQENLLSISPDLSSKLEENINDIKLIIQNTSLNSQSNICANIRQVLSDIDVKNQNIISAINSLDEKICKDQLDQSVILNSNISELKATINSLSDEIKSVYKSEFTLLSDNIIENNSHMYDKLSKSIEDLVNSTMSSRNKVSADELQTIESYADKIIAQVEDNNRNISAFNDTVSNLFKDQFNNILSEIERESDNITNNLIEQINLIKDSQNDTISNYTTQIEFSVQGYINDSIEDLKSYLDIKTDTSVINSKLDNLKLDLNKSIEDTLANLNKILEASVFESAISDIKVTNEILLNSVSEKMCEQIQNFISENVKNPIYDKLNIFDKNFIDTLIDKYEEIKLIASNYNSSFTKIQSSTTDLLAAFNASKDEIVDKLNSQINGINNSVYGLEKSFADLKAQILNKSFDEAFQASIKSQIAGIESLVNEQFEYLQDINDLCGNNLPELTEMNTIVKYNIQELLKENIQKTENHDIFVEEELNKLKADLITQFINVFNQISFVTEQEEILDFIQEKHSELITILSHIVTTSGDIQNVKKEISLINDKINSIISSDNNVNYIYSLQDIESDIANLRVVLNEMSKQDKSEEFTKLVESTNGIYDLVQSIKTDLKNLNIDGFKQNFDSLNEDIVSISTRTNKLILASDESYKTLQDNLQDFKLVINDLDERTRNFVHESGLDKIDNKLSYLNEMLNKGAQTNQVFNQVFEYLAEWVDNASVQISSISDKVDTLDDIGQIKVMLEDLKAESEDNSETEELIQALGNVFEKQAKKISSLESKLDRMIVDQTISNKNNKLDISPLEDTLNSFLVAIGDKVSSQQATIDSLEAKLNDIVKIVDNKETAQLTKKVGGMDKQIAKLNKSIEKIASHVVEK